MTQVDLADRTNQDRSQYQTNTADMIYQKTDAPRILAFISEERATGFPQPHLYDKHYINKYAYPKGLKCSGPRHDRIREPKKSLYDMHVPYNRRGFSGWKLTKRP